MNFFFGSRSTGNRYEKLSATGADALIKAEPNVLALDVRSAEEYASGTGHLQNAKLIPVQDLAHRVSELEKYKGHTIIAYCLTGRRSAKASKFLSQKGFNVINLKGGIMSWNASGLPTAKGRAR